MLNINTLYHDTVNHRFCDYPVVGMRKAQSRTNNGKPFKVWHADGTCSEAHQFGEKQFTYDYTELVQAKKDYQDRRAWLKVHNELIAKLNTLDNEILADIVKEFCENA